MIWKILLFDLGPIGCFSHLFCVCCYIRRIEMYGHTHKLQFFYVILHVKAFSLLFIENSRKEFIWGWFICLDLTCFKFKTKLGWSVNWSEYSWKVFTNNTSIEVKLCVFSWRGNGIIIQKVLIWAGCPKRNGKLWGHRDLIAKYLPNLIGAINKICMQMRWFLT